MGMDEETGVAVEHAGLGRRALIKRAAAAGALAWTAPVVIGSLASPAGAVTLSGCYISWRTLKNDDGQNPSWVSSDPNTTPGFGNILCPPSTPTVCTPTPTSSMGTWVTVSSISNGQTAAATVSVNGGYSCRIVYAAMLVNNDDNVFVCVSGSGDTSVTQGSIVFNAAQTSVDLDPAGGWFFDTTNTNTSQLAIVLQCP